MGSIILSILGKYWKWIAGLLIVVSFLGVIKYKNIEIDKDNTVIKTLNLQLTAAQKSLANATSAIDMQNAQIKKVGDAARTAKVQFDELAQQLNDEKSTHNTAIAALKNQPAPKTCIDSQQYLKKGLDEVTKW